MKSFLKLFIFLSVFMGFIIFVQPAEAKGVLSSWNNFWTKLGTSSLISTPKKSSSTLSSQQSSVSEPKGAVSKTSVLYPEISDSQIPAGFSRKDLSPYFNKISISSAYSSSQGSTPSQIRISSNLKKGEIVDITGYKIKSNLKEIIIPQAVNIYEPLGFAPQENIVLSNNNYINIYSNTSPLNKNLRLNKCIGYLEDIYNFNPSLPQNCPSVPRSEITYLSGDCQNYIFSIGSCKLPDVSFYNAFPGTDQGNACRAFLNTISHNTCYQKHRFDSDFLSNEWRVWTNYNILDPRHDWLWLFDKNGLLMDEYIY